MENIEKINQKAKEHGNLLRYVQINLEEFIGACSEEDLNVIYKCLDALQDGNFANDCFEKLKIIEGKRGLSYWRKIKEILIEAEYKRIENAAV